MLTERQPNGIPSVARLAKIPARRLGGIIPREAEESPVAVEQPVNPFSWAYLKDCIAPSPQGNVCIALALIIGFYHGWLKRTFPGALSVFAYDIPLLLGLFFAVKSVPPNKSLFPDSKTSLALRAVLVLCILFTLIPSDVPWLVRLASLRGWTFAPLMFLVGYHVLRSPKLLKLFSVLIILLSISVAIYGALQDPNEYINAKTDDEGFRKTLDGSTYQKKGGGAGFRVFSTFVGPGMFAAAMTFSILIGVAQVTGSRIRLLERVFWVLGVVASLYGLFISGSRSPILYVITGTAVILSLRRNLLKIVPAVASVGLVILLFSPALNMIDVDRLKTAFSIGEIAWRVWIVIYPTILALLEFPLGRGLGHATHGVPVILFHLLNRFTPGLIDGDLGHAAVDLGLVGMVIYVTMMVRAVKETMVWTKSLRGTDSETIGILTTALMVITFPGFVVGSPFLHVPTGAIIWYYFGGLNRLYDDRFGSKAVQKQGKMLRPMQAVPPVLVKPADEGSRLARSAKPGGPKRFLYS